MSFSRFFSLVSIKLDASYLNVKTDDVKIGFNSIDEIGMLTSSFFKIDEEEMYDALETLFEDSENYHSDWESGEELKELSKFAKKGIRLLLRYEDSKTSYALVLSGFFALLQLLFSVLSMVFATLSFVSIFSNKIKDFSKCTTRFLQISTLLREKKLLSNFGRITEFSKKA